MLQDLVNKDVIVRLKWAETEYKGRLVSTDSYFNLQLANAEEFIADKLTGQLGQILIRYADPSLFFSENVTDMLMYAGVTTFSTSRPLTKQRAKTPK